MTARNQGQDQTESAEDAARRFAGEVERLTVENADLREQLDAARANEKATPNVRPKPTEPSFGLSEGQRAELQERGKTVSPFTGARQVGDGRPRDKAGKSPVRTVDAETYDKATRK